MPWGNGGVIGRRNLPTSTSASGVWRLSEAESARRGRAWPVMSITSPGELNGLQLWMDGADSTTMYDATTGGSLVAANGAVARWEDKSGNSRHATQATAGFRPVRKTAQQNGLGALEFASGSSQRLAVSGSAATLKFLHSTAYTLFCVVKAGTTSTPNVLNPIVSTISTFSGLPGMALYHDDRSSISRTNRIGHTVTLAEGGTLVSWTTTDNYFAGGAFGIVAVTGNLASGTASGRATLYNTAGVSESNPSTTGTASTASSQSDFTIGAVSAQFWLTGQIAEIVIYDSVLSAQDRNIVRAYMKSKWGIA